MSWIDDLLGKIISVSGVQLPMRKILNFVPSGTFSVVATDNPATGATDVVITDTSTAVDGPGSSVDNSVPRFDGTTGAKIQDSLVVADDTGNVTTPGYISATANAGNNAGGNFTGHGTAPGVNATGGATNGHGLIGYGTGTGFGVVGNGGSTNGVGVVGAGHGSGQGGSFTAGGTQYAQGAAGTGGPDGPGLVGNGTGAGQGVIGYAGASSFAIGAWGVAGAGGGGIGVQGNATDSDGYGVYAKNTGGFALRIEGDTTSPVQAALRFVPQDAQPTGQHQVGDMYVTTAGVLKICTSAGTPGTWTSVGSQT